MEYASCGELFTKISNDGRLQETEAKPLFAQIVAAVEHMVVQSFTYFLFWTNHLLYVEKSIRLTAAF